MTFEIRLGCPHMLSFWNDLNEKIADKTASKEEIKLHKKLTKTFRLLSQDPKYNGLHSHEIDELSRRLGMKVWESYLENNKPAAGRIFWVYYPPGSITIIGLEPHPNDNKHSYEKITLSAS